MNSKKNEHTRFDLPEERLATTTETGKRVYLYPAAVRGFFRTRRNLVYDLLIVFFLGLPWIKINGTPLLLLNIVTRQFSIFGLTFWADEAPMLIFVFGGAVLLIVFITALFGRLWCGWACPQTVFIDRIYRRIDSWIEGTSAQRKQLDDAPLSIKKCIKKVFKYSIYLVVSLIIANSFLAYFVGMDTVKRMVTHSPFDHPSAFFVVALATAITLFDFGWFREQFCIIACPYGRLQSVMIDRQSLIIGYDSKRGEPRKKDRHDTTATGDCINCYRCVHVCPTGIDIRRGLQMECIMCTACVDACNDVMAHMKKPLNLISYTTEAKLEGQKYSWFKPRLVVYGILIALFTTGLIITLASRKPIRVFSVRGRTAYTLTQNHTVINHFKLHIYNYQFQTGSLNISLPKNNESTKMIIPITDFSLPPGKIKVIDVFVEAPKSLFKNGQSQQNLDITAKFGKSHQPFSKRETLTLVGPLL